MQTAEPTIFLPDDFSAGIAFWPYENGPEKNITNIYKSAFITVDLGHYQNIKLFSSFGIKINEKHFDANSIAALNEKIWTERGADLKYGLPICLKKIGKLPIDREKDLNFEENGSGIVIETQNADIRKSCEITIAISNGQNMKLASSKDWSISYKTEKERIDIERSTWDDISEDINKSMNLFIKSLGKKTDAPDNFSELCKQKIEKHSIIKETNKGE